MADGQRGDIPGLARAQLLDALLIHDVAVLDAVRAEPDGLLHRFWVGGMRHHAKTAGATDLECRFELSVERNPARRVLIPMYGLEAGGLVHEDLGYPFQVTPFAGLVIFAENEVSLSARGGYRWVPARFEELSGAELALMLDGHLW